MRNELTNYVNEVKTKGKGYFLSLSLFLSGVLTNTAYADDPFGKTESLAGQGITKVQGIGIVTLGLAVVVTGLIYGFGGRDVKAAIKKHWVAIAVSIIAVSAGPSIVEWGFNFVKS
ncbi:TPA: TrbC/VirB2 family protein [Streptococcus agalactiae]